MKKFKSQKDNSNTKAKNNTGFKNITTSKKKHKGIIKNLHKNYLLLKAVLAILIQPNVSIQTQVHTHKSSRETQIIVKTADK